MPHLHGDKDDVAAGEIQALLHESWAALWQKTEWLRFAGVTLLLLFASNWLGKNVLIEPASTWYRDFQLRRLPRAQEQATRIVRIDPDDHKEIFSGRSPLRGPAIAAAVCAVARSRPAVIVVDLDTSNADEFPENVRIADAGVPVVWAVDAVSTVDGEGRLIETADAVLGGRAAKQPLYGIARMPQEFDGAVRRWNKYDSIAGHWRPTLPWAAILESCRIDRPLCRRLKNRDDPTTRTGPGRCPH